MCMHDCCLRCRFSCFATRRSLWTFRLFHLGGGLNSPRNNELRVGAGEIKQLVCARFFGSFADVASIDLSTLYPSDQNLSDAGEQ
jgi:hypothetical protein